MSSVFGIVPSSFTFVTWYACSFHTRRVRTHAPFVSPKTRTPDCAIALPSLHWYPTRLLAYAFDEESALGYDPDATVGDLSNDPLEFAHRRIALAGELWQRWQARDLPAGDSLARYRRNVTRGLESVRIAGLAYQKGFGGHFHNDNSLSVLRDIPGIVVAVPARADDALALYRAARQLTARAGRVVVIVEPIALYHRRDLSQEGDAAWLAADSGEIAELGRGRMYRAEGRDLLIVSYGNGVALSLAAARTLSEEDGISARVLDLRWVSPLPHADILAQARATGRVLMVDECRHSGNLSEQVAALLLDAGYRSPFARVTGADSFIPLGDAALTVLPSEQEIVSSARALLAQS